MVYNITSLQPLTIEDRTYAEPFKFLERESIIQIKYLEFDLLKQTQHILKGMDASPLTRVLRNIYGVIELLMSRGRTIIIGATPSSTIAFLLINRLKARHRCIYFTSWPWEREAFSNGVLKSFRKSAWLKFLNRTLCVSISKLSCEALSNYGAKPIHIPHSVDAEVYRPKVPEITLKKVKVLFVGHLLKLKGVHLIISLIKKYTWEGVEFWFVGKGSYEDEVKKMQEENYPVRYLGYIRNRNQLANIMQDSDMLILPSIRIGKDEEKFGIVLLEAMACQLPVIASDCYGPKQIVENGVTGIVIPQNDELSLRDAISKLIASPELRAKLGKNGRKRVEEFYDVKKVAKKWLDIIESVHRE